MYRVPKSTKAGWRPARKAKGRKPTRRKRR